MMNFRKKSKGITLIALVITIIVILILAGVSIATLSGENGLINKTIHAKNSQDAGEIKDKVNLAQMALRIDGKAENATNIKNYLTENNEFNEEDITITSKDDHIAILKVKDVEFEFPKGIVTIYFQKGENWTSNNIYAYIWKGENTSLEVVAAWPGQQMELVNQENGIYKYTVPENFHGENIIFNDNNETQTEDLRIADDAYIFRVRNSNASRTVYYTTKHTDPVNIHMWKDGGGTTDWPGVAATFVKSVGDTRYFKYDIPEEYDEFLFAEVNGNNEVQHQTHDLNFEGGGYIYNGVDGDAVYREVYKRVYSNGAWSKYTN